MGVKVDCSASSGLKNVPHKIQNMLHMNSYPNHGVDLGQEVGLHDIEAHSQTTVSRLPLGVRDEDMLLKRVNTNIVPAIPQLHASALL